MGLVKRAQDGTTGIPNRTRERSHITYSCLHATRLLLAAAAAADDDDDDACKWSELKPPIAGL